MDDAEILRKYLVENLSVVNRCLAEGGEVAAAFAAQDMCRRFTDALRSNMIARHPALEDRRRMLDQLLEDERQVLSPEKYERWRAIRYRAFLNAFGLPEEGP